jgi:Flp pilus assembly protein protease CpaA
MRGETAVGFQEMINMPELSWPIYVGMVLLLISAIINVMSKEYLVPNWLSLSSLVGGVLVAVIWGPSFKADIVSCAMGALIGLFGMVLPFSKGYLGAGSVKMQMAFGAWVGAGASSNQTMGMMIGTTLLAALAALGLGFILMKQMEKRLAVDPNYIPNMRTMPVQPIIFVASVVGLYLAKWLAAGEQGIKFV